MKKINWQKNDFSKSLNLKDVQSWLNESDNSSVSKIATNALYKLGIKSAALKPESQLENNFDFAINLASQRATSQLQSGRCWLFAAVNLIRENLCKKLNIDNLELSQSYLAFWDKFERANFMLECIIDTVHEKVSNRYVHYFLTSGVADGGQWDMINNVVEKYGIVPKNIMPDTYASSHTNELNYLLNWILKSGALKIRKNSNKSFEELQKIKENVLEEVFRLLTISYGKLPEKFDFVATRKIKLNSKFKTMYDTKYEKFVDKNLTALTFYKKYIKPQLNDYISLINAPTKSKPMYQRFSFKYLNNVIGGKPIMHQNVEINLLKYLAIKTLFNEKPLWFGADVSFYGDSLKGFWNDKSFDYNTLLGTTFDLDKGQEIDYRSSSMNHAMLITGVDLDLKSFKEFEKKLQKLSGKKALEFINSNYDKLKVSKWKIQNSWSEKVGNKGYYVMSESWFNKYVFQLVIEKNLFNSIKKKLNLKSFDNEPIILEPWDPIGTLA